MLGSCSGRHCKPPTSGSSPIRDDSSRGCSSRGYSIRGCSNPNRGGSNPKQGRGQTRRAGDVRPIPNVRARLAGNPSGRKRARLSGRRRYRRSRGRVPSALRPSSQPPDWRMRRAKARSLERRLQILFCACWSSFFSYFSERTEVGVHRCTPLHRRESTLRMANVSHRADGKCSTHAVRPSTLPKTYRKPR